jgi:arylsulfatase A
MMNQTFPARLLLGIFLAGALPVHAQTNQPPARPRRDSIILVLADGLDCNDLPCYGGRPGRTPNLDRLAAEGVRFTGYYAGSPFKFPARAALLTGRDAGHLRGPADTEVFLPNDGPTLAEVLKAAGYHTGCVGNWGLASERSLNVPQRRGFDEWAGFYSDAEADDEYPGYVWRYDPPRAGLQGYEGRVSFSQNDGGYHGESARDIFLTAATNFVKINKPEQFNGHRPFFLLYASTLPRGGKADAVAKLDADIGTLIDTLKDLHIESNTLVFVTSDTGAWKKQANRATNAADGLREAGLRVPLLAWCPSKIRANEENYLPCAAWDLLPTFAEIGRGTRPDNCDGISFLQPLLGRPQLQRHEFLYWETHPETGRQQAVRMGDWKAERSAPGRPLELFNLKADDAEKTNVAGDHPEVVKQIEDFLKTRADKP